MKPNLGTADRVIRALIGTGIIIWGAVAGSWLGAIGAVPLLTAVLGFCPAYCPLGINTTGKGGKGNGCCGGGQCSR